MPKYAQTACISQGMRGRRPAQICWIGKPKGSKAEHDRTACRTNSQAGTGNSKNRWPLQETLRQLWSCRNRFHEKHIREAHDALKGVFHGLPVRKYDQFYALIVIYLCDPHKRKVYESLFTVDADIWWCTFQAPTDWHTDKRIQKAPAVMRRTGVSSTSSNKTLRGPMR